MDNPNGSFEYRAISAAGTIVVRQGPASVHLFAPEVSTGTITLYDSATAAGTASTNRVYSFAGGTAAQDCFPRVLDIQFKTGIVYTAVGTPVALLAVA